MFEVISPTAVRRLKAERIGNLEALLRNAVSHLEEVSVLGQSESALCGLEIPRTDVVFRVRFFGENGSGYFLKGTNVPPGVSFIVLFRRIMLALRVFYYLINRVRSRNADGHKFKNKKV